MTKRRTRKQKESAHTSMHISWTPRAASASDTKSVKRELNSRNFISLNNVSNTKSSDVMAKDEYLGTMKQNIIKTLAITTFILGLELVLYWALKG